MSQSVRKAEQSFHELLPHPTRDGQGAASRPGGEPQPDPVIAAVDPEVAEAILLELRRQEERLELIASENYASPAVMRAQGCVMTNKYAEGLPGRRYYGGCEYVDI
ncbi:MAG TPA: hypothetical protein VIL11_05570, partial [Limnochordales bacterium]